MKRLLMQCSPLLMMAPMLVYAVWMSYDPVSFGTYLLENKDSFLYAPFSIPFLMSGFVAYGLVLYVTRKHYIWHINHGAESVKRFLIAFSPLVPLLVLEIWSGCAPVSYDSYMPETEASAIGLIGALIIIIFARPYIRKHKLYLYSLRPASERKINP